MRKSETGLEYLENASLLPLYSPFVFAFSTPTVVPAMIIVFFIFLFLPNVVLLMPLSVTNCGKRNKTAKVSSNETSKSKEAPKTKETKEAPPKLEAPPKSNEPPSKSKEPIAPEEKECKEEEWNDNDEKDNEQGKFDNLPWHLDREHEEQNDNLTFHLDCRKTKREEEEKTVPKDIETVYKEKMPCGVFDEKGCDFAVKIDKYIDEKRLWTDLNYFCVYKWFNGSIDHLYDAIRMAEHLKERHKCLSDKKCLEKYTECIAKHKAKLLELEKEELDYLTKYPDTFKCLGKPDCLYYFGCKKHSTENYEAIQKINAWIERKKLHKEIGEKLEVYNS